MNAKENIAINRKQQPVRIKIISLGNAEVGKSCIIKRFCEKRFVPKYLATIGIDYGVTKITCRDRAVKVNIFDMAGPTCFYEVRNEFYADTHGVLLVYDVTDHASFDSLNRWMEELQQELTSSHGQFSNLTCVVCANKIDKMRRVVDEADGRLWADMRGFQHFDVSALSGDGVSTAFEALFEGIIASLDNGGRKPEVHLSYTREQVEAIQRLKTAKDDYQRLGLSTNATSDDVNKAFRRLSVLLHPDKSVAPGSEEAFKLLVAARVNLLQIVTR